MDSETNLLRSMLDWLDVEIASSEDWIDRMRQKSNVNPVMLATYEGERSGLAQCRKWLIRHRQPDQED